MKICLNLLMDINLEDNAIQPCCNVFDIKVPSYPFSGLPSEVEGYFEYIIDSIHNLQTDTDLCKGCNFLIDVDIKKDINALKSSICFKTVSINHHRYYCNCKCVYCDYWHPRKKEKLYSVLPLLKTLVHQNRLAPQCSISWGGGESTILKEFDEASAWLTAKGYTQLVHSNALLYSKGITSLLKSGKGDVNVSLDSGTKETYYKIKGRDHWDKVIENLTEYSKACAKPDQLELKYIVFEQNNNFDEIELFFQLCLRLNVKKVNYSLDFREVNANAISKQTFIATAFFRKRAEELNILARPFYINAQLIQEIDVYQKHYFQSGEPYAKP
ncbi:radical SAM protein [Desulfovibrio litoralis]|uniref:Radical SAM superfamily protein n=1 Tax=Desulfovibrio litoralis DSM 11393 TaxID=1121455 RepID=A0A1M7SAZ9_9BACT|nr:radical SAM protein [Desulfovibrio litoralis]SHN55564.1 Radical SAM superfamily protein [Desulfovibrio litoralis DSM 11393]